MRNSPNRQQTEDCAQRAPLNTNHFSDHEKTVLFIMRCYFLSYTSPTSSSWENGIEAAVLTFGGRDGPNIAWLCLKTVQSMRLTRRGMFSFCNPFCRCCKDRLTQHESHIMNCVFSVKSGETGRLHLASMMLCEGNNDKYFIEAIENLTAALENFEV